MLLLYFVDCKEYLIYARRRILGNKNVKGSVHDVLLRNQAVIGSSKEKLYSDLAIRNSRSVKRTSINYHAT